MIAETEKANVIYQYLKQNNFNAIDYSDLLRFQWVQVISALDKFMHDLILAGITNVYLKKRPITPALKSFKATNLHNIIVDFDSSKSESERLSSLQQLIIEANSFKSFQKPEKIAEGLACIWEEAQKWQKISAQMKRDERQVKTELSNISTRRDQIVHESDYQAASLGRQNIIEGDTKIAIDFIKKLGKAIYECVK
ncbi:MAG: hypothetical protein LBM71_00870 [Elusimicrobiota bacterium]|nr:hypothetical protein [Elusimicrobiota bacterium]